MINCSNAERKESVSIGLVWALAQQEMHASITMILEKKAYRAMWIAGSGCGVIVNGRRADSNTTPQRKAQRERERAVVRGHWVILMAGKELAVGEEATEKQKHLVTVGRKRASVATAIRADSATIRPRRARERDRRGYKMSKSLL